MLTKREKQVLEAVEEYISDNGFAPSVREIGDIVGLSSSSTVHQYLTRLEEKGYIERKNKAPRAMTVIKKQNLKDINITVTDEDFKTIITTIIARQSALKLKGQKYGPNDFDLNEIDELEKLFQKLLVYVDEVEEKGYIET